MRYGSVCSGIEAASVAWHGLGWKPAWFAEIEKFPCELLAHHYPNVPNLGDMTKISDRVISGEVAAPDILVGGTPCQAFSVAGLRNSLDDDRGLLTLEFVRLADAIDSARIVRREQPCIVVWENVPGVLNTKDNAFGCFLGAISGAGCELQPPRKKWGNAGYIAGPQRQVAWRVLDAQYFGLAQRRRRVFIVASAMARFDPSEILFERKGVPGNSAQGRNTQKDIAGTLEKSIARSRGAGTSPAILTIYKESSFAQYTESPVAATLFKRGGCADGGSESLIIDSQCGKLASGKPVTGTLLSNAGTKLWLGNQEAFSGDFFVIHGTQDPLVNKNIAHPLGRNNGQENAILDSTVYSIAANTIGRSLNAGGNGIGVQKDISYTLTTADVHAVFQQNSRDEVRFISSTGQIAGALAAQAGMKQQNYLFNQTRQKVRRFMPIECERLQGFADNYTLIPSSKKTSLTNDELVFLREFFPEMPEMELRQLCADGPRYAALGNSMAVPVMRWIGDRIAQYMAARLAA